VTGFFSIAWALPWRWALWTALLGAGLLRLLWWLNSGVCVLTQLERSLRGLNPVPGPGQPHFIEALAARWTEGCLPRAWIRRATNFVLWGGAGVAALRLVAW